MPELPEVETIRRMLAPVLAGRRIRRAWFLSPLVADGRPEELSARIEGARIERVERLGKHLLIRLENGTLDIHLRMTGKLLLNAAPGPYARAVLELDRGCVAFDDVRQFGRMRWWPAGANPPDLGPDALKLPPGEFTARLRGRRGRIKPLLLNQTVIAGIGNIYADEALFRAGIHPLAPVLRLGPRRVDRLHKAIAHVLEEAIEAGGSSVSDYLDARGERGSFQERHQVYGRAGEACVRCGAPVRRIVVAQRGTHFCAACQRR